ncbi:MAG: hypothetical protein WA688_02890 [Thermoplasmata archaeon]
MADRGFREYHVSTVFRVPLRFAFEWCTDYSPEDAKITGEDKAFGLQRRIVQRNLRQVIFENIYDHGAGWAWERHTVTLSPPDRWHSDGYGNFHEAHLDYRLTELSGNQTQFDMRWKSKPTVLSTGARSPTAEVERFVQRLWRIRGRALEREYRTSKRNGRSR